MKESIILILIIWISAFKILANKVDSITAVTVAVNYFEHFHPQKFTPIEIDNMFIQKYRGYNSFYVINFKEGGFIVGGDNYGQGSSREHAAIAPKYLGLKAVIVKSFARIHLANLVNFGIVPLTFENKDDYNKIDQGDNFEIDLTTLQTGKVKLKNLSKNVEIPLTHALSETEIEVLKAGGKLPHIKQKHT